MPQKSIIQASEQPIAKIFSSEYSFVIPDFQRPYSWGRDQVDELLDDLTYFAFQEGDVGDLNPYFLGSIVLIEGSDPAAKVIDGQQRLTTLTILFAVLRELLPNLKEDITNILCEPGRFLTANAGYFVSKVSQREFVNQAMKLKVYYQKFGFHCGRGINNSLKTIFNVKGDFLSCPLRRFSQIVRLISEIILSISRKSSRRSAVQKRNSENL